MQKRTFGILLVLCMLLGVLLAMPASAADVVEIATADDLVKLMNYDSSETDEWKLDGHYKLTADIDLTGKTQKSIGKGTSIDARFTGTFDGNGKKISGLNISTTAAGTGLFGNAGAGAVIKNLTVSGTVKSTANGTGGVVGYSAGTLTVSNCVFEGSVSGKERTAGIVGAYDTVASNPDSVALIVGCVNKGAITATSTKNGGIVGGMKFQIDGTNATITNCANQGTVTTTSAVGGFGGILGFATSNNHLNNLTISNCVNTSTATIIGKATGNGGVIGRLETNGDIVNGDYGTYKWLVTGCTNYASVTDGAGNTGYAGGVVGLVTAKSLPIFVENCQNHGEVYCNATTSYVAGVVGYVRSYVTENMATVDNCYNTGKVSSGSKNTKGAVAGIAHLQALDGSAGTKVEKSTIKNSINVGTVSGNNSGLVVSAVSADRGYFTNNYAKRGDAWVDTTGATATISGLDSAIWDLTGAAPVLKHAHVFVRSATDATKHVCAHCDMNAVAHDYSYNTTKEMHFCVCGAFGTHTWDTSDADEHVCPTCSFAEDHIWLDVDATNHECEVCEKLTAHVYEDYECACGHDQPIITLTVTALNPYAQTVTFTGDTEDGDVTLDFAAIVVDKIGDDWTASNLQLAGADKAHYALAADTFVFVPAEGDVLTVTVTDNAGKFTVEIYKGNSFSTTVAAAPSGYEFIGWHDSTGALVTKEKTFTTVVLENIVLTAKYAKTEENKRREETTRIIAIAVALNSPKKYTVSFKSVGAKLYDSQTVKKGQMIVLPEAPTKEGFVFAGWATDINGTKLYNWNAKLTGDITLYAKWVKA